MRLKASGLGEVLVSFHRCLSLPQCVLRCVIAEFSAGTRLVGGSGG